ncbi:MAG: hypothetical protein K8S16_17330 [Bacteroidales bacterium]|nr:hypothetical protein [Bacteroidales bacterium]
MPLFRESRLVAMSEIDNKFMAFTLKQVSDKIITIHIINVLAIFYKL